MASNQEPVDRLKQEQDRRRMLTNLRGSILLVKVERLALLEEHYVDFWLDLHMKDYEAKLDSIVNRAKATVFHISKKKIEGLKSKFEREISALDNELAEAQTKLDKFNNLDPDIMAEYLKLKDDIECQNLLVEISNENK